MKLRLILESISNEQEVRIAAWLFMLEYSYNQEMKISSWKNDSRMGVGFSEAMETLNKKGLVEMGNEVVKPKPGSKNYLFKIFGKAKDEDEAYEFGEKLKRFDTSKFPISNIPIDIFENEYNLDVKSRKPSDIGHSKYNNLFNWIKKFQRDSNLSFKSEFLQFKNDEKLIDLNKTYVLYRGLFISKYNEDFDKFSQLKVGQSIDNKNISWSWSKSSAMKFAKGSTNWMDQPKWKSGESIAIILQHQFNQDELLCDLYYMDLIGYNFIDFPDEKEVIVFPKNRKCKIIEILK